MQHLEKRIVYESMSTPSTRRCNFCHIRDLPENGVTSITLCDDDNDKKGPWFCSQTCMCMRKYELGYPSMSKNQHSEILKKCYPKIYNYYNRDRKSS